MKRYLATLPLLTLAFGHAPVSAESVAITNVTVVPIATDHNLEHRTVVIEDGKITRIDSSNKVPKGATRIDGTGKFLMPALADMHAHVFMYFPDARPSLPLAMEAPIPVSPTLACAARNEMYLYLANGVTTVRDMSGTATRLQWADKIARKEIDGPHLHVATRILDGNPPANPPGTAITFDRPDQVPQAIKTLAATKVGNSRYEFIKIYEQMQPEVYDEVVKQARIVGLPVVGHVPFQVPVERVIADGQRSIEHLRGYEVDMKHVPTSSLSIDRWRTWQNVSDERIDELAKLTAGKDTWNVPTLVIVQDGMSQVAVDGLDGQAGLDKYVSKPLNALLHLSLFPANLSKDIFDAQLSVMGKERKMISALGKYGAKIMTGTDAPGLGVIPGVSLHREIELLVDFGLTPAQALRAATLEPQKFLKDDRAGYVGVGAQGDYLLIDGDPVADVRNTRRISGVMVAGKWWPVAALQAKLEETRACAQ